MKFTLLVLAALGLSCSAWARYTPASPSPSQSMDQFCADRANPQFEKNLTRNLLSLFSFENQGGLGNGGVCWWHSRFQRNSLYLTVYRPGEERPSQAELEKIIAKIRTGNSVVVIPGYSDFSEFSYKNQKFIQKELENWQKLDGFAKFGWVSGISGSEVVSANELKKMMDELYQNVEVEGNIAYQKLQIKGITAHAWLVVNMKQVNGGYDLEVLDSNFPSSTGFYRYRSGQTNFEHPYYGKFTPYLERSDEMKAIKMAVMKQCNPAEYKIIKDKEERERAAKKELEDLYRN